MARDVQLEAIQVIAELDRIGWAWEPGGDDEVKVRCPAHADDHPSCSVSTSKRVFRCHVPSCGAHGDFVTFLGLATSQSSRRTVIEDLSTRYPIEISKTVDPEAVERWHSAIWDCPPMLGELRRRCVSDDAIRRYRLGFDGRRITIPIRNDAGLWVNVRRYMPGEKGPSKMKNLRGHGELRLHPLEQLDYDTVIVCGGELKAFVTAEMMNPHGVGAITATGGEGNWEPEFSRRLRGKRMFVCFDVDDEGRAAAVTVAARNRGDSRWVGVLRLDLDPDRHPHGDLNDYWAEGRSAEDLLALMEATPEWRPELPPEEQEDGETPPLVPLAETTRPERAGTRLRVAAVVTAKDEAPYLVPKRVEVSCDRRQPFCVACPVYARTPDPERGTVEMLVNPETPGVLLMVGASDRQMRDATRKALRIPPCKDAQFITKEHHAVEHLMLTPQLTLDGLSSHADGMGELRPAYFVGHGLESNAAYVLEGRVHPHPKDQRATLLARSAEPARDSLSAFQPSDVELEELSLFQPTDWTPEAVQEKLDDLYEDLEQNVTRIYRRRSLHLMIDLAYHSVLWLPFEQRQVKGWAEVLVVGDSGQGKTETSEGLQRHYGVGGRVVCKKATAAGLMGGSEQIAGRWFIRWGVVPTHDRGCLILEELKGAPTEVIGKMTDMRSSGIAEVTSINGLRRAYARTRLIAVSNPRADVKVEQHSFGLQAVRELVGSLEDVRRFDAAMVVASGQVDPAELNRPYRERPAVVHRHTSELCRRLVLWAWTRTPEQVSYVPEAADLTLREAEAMGREYTDAVPLVDRGGMRYKLARLSAALAARTFSRGNEDPRRLVVRPCHVEYATRFLRDTYSDPAFGYLDFSKAVQVSEAMADAEEVKRRLFTVPHVVDFVDQMLTADEIELRDICDWCAWEFEDARQLLSYLVRKRAIQRVGRGYRKTAPFIEMLRALRGSEELRKNARPDWVKDAFTGGGAPPREM